jgi:hypothetical protein
MSVVVECRCGETFEIDVLEISGQWWRRCPNCNPSTDEAPIDVETDESNPDTPGSELK